MDKNAVRKRLILQRNKLRRGQVTEKSQKAVNFLLGMKEVESALNILIYLPINNEVDTKNLLDSLSKKGKRVYLPAFIGGRWTVARFKDWKKLENGPFSTMQPKNSKGNSISLIDLVVVPGAGFCRDGARLGYGLGIYDRLLGKNDCIKVGLCYDFQLLRSIAAHEKDIKMDFVVTEKRILNIT